MKTQAIITLAGNTAAREETEKFILNTKDAIGIAIENDGKVLPETWQGIEMDLENLKSRLMDYYAVSPRSVEAYISLDASLDPLIKDTEFGQSLEKAEADDGRSLNLESLLEIYETSELAGLYFMDENLPWFPRSTIETIEEVIRQRYIEVEKEEGKVKISEVLEDEAAFKAMERNYYSTVERYIEENVDENDLESVEKAIFELPESKIKLRLYDMAYRLKEKVEEA